MGRKKKPYSKQIWSRVTDKQLARLDRVASALGMNRCDFIRTAVMRLVEEYENQATGNKHLTN